MQKLSKILVLVAGFVLVGSLSFADRYVSYPGTAAKGMGGAYTAIAKDATAIWYNPAGLAGGGTDIVVELSNAPEVDGAGNYTSEGMAGFIGGKWNKDGRFGVALAYYKPYSIVDLGVQIFSGGIGYRFESWEWLSLGGTFEVTYTGDESEMFNPNDTNNFPSTTLGAMIDLSFLKSLDPTMEGSVGLTYRAAGGVNKEAYNEVSGIDYSLTKPSSYDVGLAISKGFTSFPSRLTGSIQLGSTNYSDASDAFVSDYIYDRLSYGFEYAILTDAAKYALRAGYYSSEWDFDTITGKTFGAGVNFGDKYGLEFAYDKRVSEWSGDVEETNDFLSFAVVYSFY